MGMEIVWQLSVTIVVRHAQALNTINALLARQTIREN